MGLVARRIVVVLVAVLTSLGIAGAGVVGPAGGVAPASPTSSHAVTTYTHAPGFPKSNELANPSPQTTITLPMTTGALGDLVVALVHNGVYTPRSTIAYATGVTDRAGAVTWRSAASVRAKDTSYPDTPAGQSYEVWYGVVKKAATPTTVTATFRTPVTDLFLYLDQWGSSHGSRATWRFVTGSSVAVDTNATTVDFPRLGSDDNAGIYWGYAYGSIHDTSMTAGSTPGFTYYKSPRFGNVITYNGRLAASTPRAPTCTQAFSGGTGWYDTIAAIFTDGSGAGVGTG